ncbi:MAG: hypothetical protein LBL80_01290 [Ruminococcus sp.]|jgi:hypothetical protein|nr:hypothetical protein [Ruminococcus sp.]
MNDAQFSAYNLSIYLNLKDVYESLNNPSELLEAKEKLANVLNVLKSSELTPGSFPPFAEKTEKNGDSHA